MPLPSVVEFLVAQTRPDGSPLCSLGVVHVSVVIPAGITVKWTVTPGPNAYLSYDFRALVGGNVVPGAFRLTVNQYGVRPYTGVLQAGLLGRELDYFLRVSHAQPVINEVVNLTVLNQQWDSYDQFVNVTTEADYGELERRLREHFFPFPALVEKVTPVDLSGVEKRLDELVRITSEGLLVTPSPPLKPLPKERWTRLIGPGAEHS